MPKSSTDRRTPRSRSRCSSATARAVGHDRALRDLEAEPVRRDAVAPQQPVHLVDEVGVPQAARGQVDRHADVVTVARQWPQAASAESSTRGQRVDEAAALGDGDELVRRDVAQLGVAPPPAPRRAPPGRRTTGRVAGRGPGSGRSAGPSAAPRPASAGAGCSCRAPARRHAGRGWSLGVVHRHVGALEQGGRVVGVVGARATPMEPPTSTSRPSSDTEGFRARAHPASDPEHSVLVGVRQEDRELVAAQAGHVPAVPTAAASRDDLHQEKVACSCPRVSLTSLKSSRSRIMTAAPVVRPAVTSSRAAPRRRCRLVRFGSPVSASCRASCRS